MKTLKIGDHELEHEHSAYGLNAYTCKYCRISTNPTRVEENKEWIRISPCYKPENWNKEPAD